MDKHWNLNSIYKSFHSDDFLRDISNLDKEILDLKTFGEKNFSFNPIDTIEEYLVLSNTLSNRLYRLMSFCSLSLAVDTSNKDAINFMDIFRKKSNETVAPFTKFRKWCEKINDLDSLSEKSALIKSHLFYLKEMRDSAKHLLSPETEDIISSLQRTGSSAFSSLQNQLTSNLSVFFNYNGKNEELSLSQARNMYFDKDKDKREKIYHAEIDSYKTVEIPSSACLNAIKGEVITLSKRRGFTSPLEMTLEDNRMDIETLNSLLDSMRSSLPMFRKYYKRKAQIIRGKDKIPYYDIAAPVGEVDISFTYEEAADYIVKAELAFSEEISNFMKSAFDNCWLDVEPRKGKRGGAFCSTIHAIGESRILANFNGSFDNMITLAHELGHAYHGRVLKDESILNSDYTMPLAETASIFSETVVMDYSLKNLSGDNLFTILENDISGAATVIVDIYSRYLFETYLFEERNNSILSPERLNELMVKAQIEAYGDCLDENYFHPYMWINKPHYYYPNSNFYNFPYAFGLLFAKGLYSLYKNNPSGFLEKYKSILRLTGRETVYNVGLSAEIDLHNRKFFDDSISMISDSIERFLTMK